MDMRFIDLGTVTPEQSVRIDKAMLNSYSEDTLLIYSRDRACISIGRFQRVDDVVDQEYIKKNDIPVVRRISGGSGIYSDEDQLTYSLIVSKGRLPVKRSDSFALICGAVVGVLKELGIEGKYKEINDILVNGKKISGGAQAHTKNAILQHGSIILDVNDEIVRSVLKDNKKRVYDGLTSVRECLGYIPSRSEISEAFVRGFSGAFGPVSEGMLSDEENEIVRGTSL